MKAIILAGGQGTRLRPVTYEIPKSLVTVKKKPIVNYLVDLFARHGVNNIALLVNRAHEEDFKKWQEAWKSELPQGKITIFFEEKPRGTFGGLEYARGWLGNERFILSNGDELKDFDLGALSAFHKARNPVGTIALVEVPNPHEYGVPVLDGDRIREFLEKPNPAPSRFISSGLYVLEPEVFSYADFAKELIMIEKDIFPKLAADGKLFGMKVEGGRWYDCGNLERWEKAIREW
jgi:NDP-sugar pyrophosphorylase family protein